MTGAYLGQFGVDDVFREITRRLGELLEVDTAAVLPRDQQADHLVAWAAYGVATR